MPKTVFGIITFLSFCIASSAQDAAYYKAIQKGSSSNQVQPQQFKKMEENALKDYSLPEIYELLATSFGDTTERVWAVIYGEVYCNLSSDSGRVSQMGSLVYQWYDKSLSKKGNDLSVDFTENAQASQKQVQSGTCTLHRAGQNHMVPTQEAICPVSASIRNYARFPTQDVRKHSGENSDTWARYRG